jgi:hypothetical protein
MRGDSGCLAGSVFLGGSGDRGGGSCRVGSGGRGAALPTKAISKLGGEVGSRCGYDAGRYRRGPIWA